jgi:hypothetical protein
MHYSVGDVVLVKFPWRDENNEIKSKPRPAIIFKTQSEIRIALIKITSKNRLNQFPGRWIVKDSQLGKQMGLLMDSFIHLQELYWINPRLIIRKIGNYPEMDSITQDINNLGISIRPEITE